MSTAYVAEDPSATALTNVAESTMAREALLAPQLTSDGRNTSLSADVNPVPATWMGWERAPASTVVGVIDRPLWPTLTLPPVTICHVSETAK